MIKSRTLRWPELEVLMGGETNNYKILIENPDGGKNTGKTYAPLRGNIVTILVSVDGVWIGNWIY
jgi:hypothetical protein